MTDICRIPDEMCLCSLALFGLTAFEQSLIEEEEESKKEAGILGLKLIESIKLNKFQPKM
jgi:hypothetical protein